MYGQMKTVYILLSGNTNVENLGVEWRHILKPTFGNCEDAERNELVQHRNNKFEQMQIGCYIPHQVISDKPVDFYSKDSQFEYRLRRRSSD
jgi:hypothetical protein